MTSYTKLVLASCTFALLIAAPSQAQVFQVPSPDESGETLSDESIRRRVEALLRGGRRQDAAKLLEERAEQQELEPALKRRLARIYRDLERYDDLEALLAPELERPQNELDLGSLRMLAEARYALDRPADARLVLDRILATDPGDPSLLRLVSNVLTQHGRTEEAIDLLVEGRERMGEPSEFAQQLGSLYSHVGDWSAAASEYLRVVVDSPMNLNLMRGQILELAERDGALDGIVRQARQVADANPEIPQLQLILAELLQRAGKADEAWKRLRPLVVDPELMQDFIQMSMAGLADSRLSDSDPKRTLGSLQLSARVLEGLLISGNLPNTLEPRVYDTLNRTLLAMLDNRYFSVLTEEEQLAVLDEARSAILDMGERFPNNRVTSSALLRLANVYVESLHRPQDAIDLYQRLSMSPNAPREQLQLARVGLGRSYIAAGDTARSRELFTEMGKDRDFAEGQGRAHYHLGLLDFMGGHFETAQQRLSSVALDAPTADYTNDALDLSLLLAEQLLSPSGGDAEALTHYGQALYYRATFAHADMRRSLQEAAGSSSLSLQQRSRLDLARHYQLRGQTPLAVAELETLEKTGAGRYSTQALELRGDLLVDQGQWDEARRVYESIVLEHESYVLIDGVREKLRALPTEDEMGDLP